MAEPTNSQLIASRVADFRARLRATLDQATARARASQKRAVAAMRGDAVGTGPAGTGIPTSTYRSSMEVSLPPRADGVAKLLPGVSKLFTVPRAGRPSSIPRQGPGRS
jgi:hypothetical protein